MNRMLSRRQWLSQCLTLPSLLRSLAGAGFANQLIQTGTNAHLSAGQRAAPITALAFAPAGGALLAASQSGVSLRDHQTQQQIGSIRCRMDDVHDLRFAPDGKTLGVAGGVPSESGIVELYSWPDQQRLQRLNINIDSLYAIDFAPDGSRWVVASADGTCSVYPVGAEQPISRFGKHSRSALAACFLPDSRTVVSASRDQTLRVWDSDRGENIRTMHNHSGDVTALALRPTADGLPMVASASADFTIRFWQPTIGRMVRFIRLPSQPLCIGWFERGQRLIAGCQDGKARIVDPLTVEVIRTLELSVHPLFCVAIDPADDGHAVVGTTNGRIEHVPSRP